MASLPTGKTESCRRIGTLDSLSAVPSFTSLRELAQQAFQWDLSTQMKISGPSQQSQRCGLQKCYKIHFADRDTEARWLRHGAFGQGIQECLQAAALAGLSRAGDWRLRRVQAQWQEAGRRCFWRRVYVWTAFTPGDRGPAPSSRPVGRTIVGSRGTDVSLGSLHCATDTVTLPSSRCCQVKDSGAPFCELLQVTPPQVS